jgi:hypothetical protein
MLRDTGATEALRSVQFVERKKHFHPFGDKANPLRGLAAGAYESIEQWCRQALVQGEAAGGTDMNAIALHAVGASAVTFVDGDAHAGLFQTLHQRQTADAAADDDDVERRVGRGDHGFDVRLRDHRITPATCSSATRVPMATMNPRPTGDQPYQVKVFSAYFQASRSILFASLAMMHSVQTNRIFPPHRVTRLFSRSLGWRFFGS